jgi:hypothetical protein
MSLFQTEEINCGACKEPIKIDVVYSVNADRRPDYRDAILAGTFQQISCPKCSYLFRMEPELTYLDMGRGQWILVRSARQMADWDALEEAGQVLFAASYGENAPEPAQEMGRRLKPRVAFGWPALREKIVTQAAEMDDVTLELMKLAILRGGEDLPITDDLELRLAAVEGDELLMGWINPTTEAAVESLRVPKSLYDEISRDEPAWKAAREQLGEGLFVDVHRMLVPAGEQA